MDYLNEADMIVLISFLMLLATSLLIFLLSFMNKQIKDLEESVYLLEQYLKTVNKAVSKLDSRVKEIEHKDIKITVSANAEALKRQGLSKPNV